MNEKLRASQVRLSHLYKEVEMSQERISDVKVNMTPNKDIEQHYTKSDLEVVFRRGEWSSWNEVIDWLKEHGEADNELTPGEVIAMKRDLEQLKQQGKQFTADADAVYKLTKGGAAATHDKPR